MSGKKASFSPEENSALRAALRRLQKDRDLSQEELGKILGMTQQNAGRLITTQGGMGRGTANALARELGYRDADSFLLELSINESPVDEAGGATREGAIAMGRKFSFDEDAIQSVIARYSEAETQGRPLKWWFTKFGAAELELAADARRPPPPAPMKPGRRL